MGVRSINIGTIAEYDVLNDIIFDENTELEYQIFFNQELTNILHAQLTNNQQMLQLCLIRNNLTINDLLPLNLIRSLTNTTLIDEIENNTFTTPDGRVLIQFEINDSNRVIGSVVTIRPKLKVNKKFK